MATCTEFIFTTFPEGMLLMLFLAENAPVAEEPFPTFYLLWVAITAFAPPYFASYRLFVNSLKKFAPVFFYIKMIISKTFLPFILMFLTL